MDYSTTYVRYERRGTRVVPVRVTKQWVTAEGMRGQLKARVFKAVRVTELKMRDVRGDREAAPEAWSSTPERVESRERLHGLVTKYTLEDGGLPVAWCAGAGEPTLEMGDEPLTARQANQPMDAEPESREWYLRRQWAELRGHEDDSELEAA